MIRDLLLALGLVLVIEGLLYALVPGQLRAMARFLQKISDEQLRLGGATAIALGVVIVWLVRTALG
jgi:uncharacterized protein YjeT (DUF2065 family)